MNSLDLSVMVNKIGNVTLPDNETVLQVKKPTQKQLFIFDHKAAELDKATNTEEQVNVLNDLTLLILNNNKDDIKITREQVEDFTFDMLYAVYLGYKEFVSEITSDPN